jgi:hypothetical protein
LLEVVDLEHRAQFLGLVEQRLVGAGVLLAPAFLVPKSNHGRNSLFACRQRARGHLVDHHPHDRERDRQQNQ